MNTTVCFTQKEKDIVRTYFRHKAKGFADKTEEDCFCDIADLIKESVSIIGYTTTIYDEVLFWWANNVVTYHTIDNWWKMERI